MTECLTNDIISANIEILSIQNSFKSTAVSYTASEIDKIEADFSMIDRLQITEQRAIFFENKSIELLKKLSQIKISNDKEKVDILKEKSNEKDECELKILKLNNIINQLNIESKDVQNTSIENEKLKSENDILILNEALNMKNEIALLNFEKEEDKIEIDVQRKLIKDLSFIYLDKISKKDI